MNSKLLIVLLFVFFVFNLKSEETPDMGDDLSIFPASADTGEIQCHTCQWCLSSNLLYDAAMIPNISAECLIAKGWSAGAGWMHAWWKNLGHNFCWRIYGLELNVRKYIFPPSDGRYPAGHHIGVYGRIFTYDFQIGKKGYMAGKPDGNLLDRAHFNIGLQYGYSLPIKPGINIDFSLGVGYIQGKYYEYLHIDGCNVWQSTKQQKWFGPTNAEVSLVWIPCFGHSTQKGGHR